MSNAPQYSVWVNACEQIWQTKNNPTHLDVHVINPPFVEHRRRFLSILPEPHGSEEHLRRVLRDVEAELFFDHGVAPGGEDEQLADHRGRICLDEFVPDL